MESGVADLVEYYYDLDHFDGPMGDQNLVNLVNATRPDLMLFSSYNKSNKTHPNFDVLKTIRSKCGIPIVVIWNDSLSKGSKRLFLQMSGSVDLNVLMDSQILLSEYPGVSQHLRVWTPNDENLFRPRGEARDIDVSFIGSTGSYRDIRNTFLDHIDERKIPLLRTGGQLTPITLDEYAETMRRSKISINFSQSIPGTHQLKARVFEILFSGSLLMEPENPETTMFFDPMVNYVSFSTKEDLADKISYYLEHDDERQKIAESGYRRAVTEYNHSQFWNKVMSELERLNLLPAFSPLNTNVMAY